MQGTVEREYKPPKGAAKLAMLTLIATAITHMLAPVIAIDIAVFIIAATMFLRWQVRCSMNLQALGTSNQRFSPSTGVVWWFVPIANFVIPCSVVAEIWRRSHPNAKSNGEGNQRGGPKSILVPTWWLTWLISTFIGLPVQNSGDPSTSSLVAYALTYLIALVLVIVLIQQITSNQEKRYASLTDPSRTS